MSGLRSWNFWTPVYGTLYGYRAYHPDDFLLQLQGYDINPRVIYAYGGKTTRRDWEARVEEHMWGGGQYDTTPDPWADTVLGWRPDGTVAAIMAAGGYWNMWQGRTVPLILSIGEVLIAIKLRRPVYNYQWNLGNRRRIPIPVQEDQRELRDLARGATGSLIRRRQRPKSKSRGTRSLGHQVLLASPVARRASNIPRLFGYYRRWVLLAAVLLIVGMFWPGMPGADAVSAALVWVNTHRDQLIAGGVVLAAVLIAGPRMLKTKPSRRRSRRRARRR